MVSDIARAYRSGLMDEIRPDGGTAAHSVVAPQSLPSTRPTTVLFIEDANEVVNKISSMDSSVRKLRSKLYEHEWDRFVQRRVAVSPLDILNELADLGFAWRDVARLVGVSVPAVQKWRKGENLSGDNRRRLAGVIAAYDVIAGRYSIDHVPSWFETPVHDAAPVTPIDLWSAGRRDLVFEAACQGLSSDAIMDQYMPDWRDRFTSNFETFVGSDNELSIRMRER